MDSRAVLDSALFQLTPTRTRFDLVLFCGSKKEKLASGIFEPFISHLKFARDQISKGGYSISLHPPTSHSSWFTKSTFDRFVRFVNTPAIIERFATLEKEILQIEHSIQANEIANAEQLQDGSNVRKSNESSKKESENGNEAGEETSKIQLQRLLETRRTLLRREQAMAYARGVVAGYEIDTIDDLILFADAFGASREACVKYKELWKKKHGDGLWMAELAAVKAIAPEDMSLLGSSGIILTSEGAPLPLNRTHSSEITDQQASAVPNFQPPMGWPNHIPQYYYPPPYQGYPYPMMQPMPGQNQGNMPWPSKGKASKKDESSGSSESSESSDSASEDSASSLEDQGKRHKKNSRRSSKKNRKKGSKTVIIRNINYITPEGRNGDVEGSEFTENGSIKETVDTAVGFLKENRAHESEEILKSSAEEKRSNENWDSFQSILMRNDDVVVSEEHFTHGGSKGLQSNNNNASGDSIVSTQKHIENGGARFDQFESEESARRVSRTRDSTEEYMLLPKRSEALGGDEGKDLYNATRGDSLVKKTGSGEDWFTTSDHRGAKQDSSYGSMSFDESCMMMTSGGSDQSKKQEFVDDSFMVRSSSLTTGDDVYDSRWRPDMSADIDIGNGQANEKREVASSWEPSDLCMIPERNSGEFLANDHSIDFSVEANARLTSNGTAQEKEDKTVSSGAKKTNGKNPEARKSRTPVRNRGETMSKSVKKPVAASRTMAQKNKFEKEEEMRKRIENLVLERQRRIAERSAATASRKATNRTPPVRERTT
ncbi:Disease resistance protein [Hirschfeldia incana]|nr:Disease resistance protein [Hirschfeldia incana]